MMSNLAKLGFKALDINGDNYLSWQLDAKTNLQFKKLGETINLQSQQVLKSSFKFKKN